MVLLEPEEELELQQVLLVHVDLDLLHDFLEHLVLNPGQRLLPENGLLAEVVGAVVHVEGLVVQRLEQRFDEDNVASHLALADVLLHSLQGCLDEVLDLRLAEQNADVVDEVLLVQGPAVDEVELECDRILIDFLLDLNRIALGMRA